MSTTNEFTFHKGFWLQLASLFKLATTIPSQDSASEAFKIVWITKLRWLALILFFLLSIPGFTFKYLDRATMPIYIGVLGCVFLFNLFSQLFWVERKKHLTEFAVFFQLVFDLFALVVLLVLSGSLSNPFFAVFCLNASLGAILVSGALGWSFLALTHLSVFLMQIIYMTDHSLGASETVQIFVIHILILSFWVVMRSLGKYLEKINQAQSLHLVMAEKQDRLRALGALSAGFSHEFASPLNAAKIRIERALRESPEDSNMKAAVDSLNSCETVIHQMNLSQMDARSFKAKDVHVLEIMEDIIESWKEENTSSHVSLSCEGLAVIQVPVMNFAQVVINLLDNAAQAGGDQKIEVHFSQNSGINELSFRDYGAGFQASVLNKIGEPFVTNKAQGTGLGLYITQIFAQSLGGDLKIENLSVGSLVSIKWPMVKVHI